MVRLLVLALLIGPFVTSELNGDPVSIGGRILPGVGHYDALSAVVAQFLHLIPFFLGRQFLSAAGDNEDVLRVLIVAGLCYSLPMLFEVRMSPQLHTWIYGYFPHSFVQQMREGGFRPVVFLGHGLLDSLLHHDGGRGGGGLLADANSRGPAAGRGRHRLPRRRADPVQDAWSAPLRRGLVLLVRFTRPQLQLRVAVALVAIALLYPMLRAADLFPTRTMVELAEAIDADRAQSLKFRFDNEDILLDRAWQRFTFGWGRFGRNRVYDAEIGERCKRNRRTLDHHHGAVRLHRLPRRVRAAGAWRWCGPLRRPSSQRTTSEQVMLGALALIVAINVVDLLPNASLSPWTWLLAGALLGRAETLRVAVRGRASVWDSRATAVGERRVA